MTIKTNHEWNAWHWFLVVLFSLALAVAALVAIGITANANSKLDGLITENKACLKARAKMTAAGYDADRYVGRCE